MEKTKKMLELEERLGEDFGVYLRREYEENRKTIKEIKLEIGIGKTTLRSWLIDYKIPIRDKSEANLPPGFVKLSKEELYRSYIVEGKSCNIIAREKKTNLTRIRNLLIKYGISLRSPSEARRSDFRISRPSKEKLEEMYLGQNLNMTQIAKRVGVKQDTINRWLEEYGIERKKVIKKPSKRRLEKLYLEEWKSQEKVAKELGVSGPTIVRWLNDYNIPVRSISESILPKDFNPPKKEELYGLYVHEGKSAVEVSKMLGVCPAQIAKLLTEYGIAIRTAGEYRLAKRGLIKPKREELDQWYLTEKKSVNEISTETGISSAAIRHCLEEYNIPIRSKSEAMLLLKGVDKPSKEKLITEYVDNKKSIAKIAAELEVSHSYVSRCLEKYGISRRNASEARLVKKGIVKPSKEELERMYIKEGKNLGQIGKEIGVTGSAIRNWLNEYNLPIRNSQRITSSKQFMDFIKCDATAGNLTAVAARLNGQAGDVEKIITEIYEGRFKDREQLHDYIQNSRAEIDSLVREGVTNLGPYLGDFTLHERDIFPVIMGEIIANVSEGIITSLEDRFMRLLRYHYGARFNADSEKTLAEIREKKEVMQGNRKNLYQRLEEHYQGVLRLKEEIR
jgi:transposase-like protein